MTESADQEHASPSSTFPAYVFQGPAQVAIRTRTNDQPKYVDTRLSAWTWYDGGIAMTIDWAALQLNSELIEIGKGFMAYALEKYAPRTVVMFADSLRFLSSTNLAASVVGVLLSIRAICPIPGVGAPADHPAGAATGR
ncbi:hypothetical protein [Pseudomonas sp.]|uniref:hypothetical protein n=1 Tax=Pseudomonas sp. TaxID=306 RepID=UPI003BB57C26